MAFVINTNKKKLNKNQECSRCKYDEKRRLNYRENK